MFIFGSQCLYTWLMASMAETCSEKYWCREAALEWQPGSGDQGRRSTTLCPSEQPLASRPHPLIAGHLSSPSPADPPVRVAPQWSSNLPSSLHFGGTFQIQIITFCFWPQSLCVITKNVFNPSLNIIKILNFLVLLKSKMEFPLRLKANS